MVHSLLTETSPSLPSREGGRELGGREGLDGGERGREGRRGGKEGEGGNANLIHRHVVV